MKVFYALGSPKYEIRAKGSWVVIQGLYLPKTHLYSLFLMHSRPSLHHSFSLANFSNDLQTLFIAFSNTSLSTYAASWFQQCNKGFFFFFFKVGQWLTFLTSYTFFCTCPLSLLHKSYHSLLLLQYESPTLLALSSS